MACFAAIDFETADNGRDSACAVSVVLVRGDQVADSFTTLIRPPRRRVMFTHIHGLTWEMLKDAPAFAEVWPGMRALIEQAEFLAAHNASFDRGVLDACCQANGFTAPARPFVCTVQLARRVWNLYPTKLNNVCDFLGIGLKHHDAGSDARACAEIVIRAHAEGAMAS